MSEQLYVWHHELHEKWGKERLYFWRLAFFPTYERQGIYDAIHRVMKGDEPGSDGEVTSYAIYETLGMFDLFLRVWLPVSRNFQGFQEELKEELRGQQLRVMELFSVGAIARHWPWLKQPDGLEMESPTEALEGPEMSQEELALGNEAARGENSKVAESYVSRKLLAPCESHKGIKFIVVVTATAQLTTLEARHDLRTELQRILTQASSGVAGSLYEGSGFGQFLIVGGVKHDGFAHISEDVIEPILKAKVGALHGARPYTFVCTGVKNPLEFKDAMPVRVDGDRRTPSVEELLEAGEGTQLEVKASAFLNVNRWLTGDGKVEESDEVFLGGVVRAVIGMLNAGGGEVVIGALEAHRFPDLDLSHYVRVGDFACLGVNVEYGGKTPDWDRYALNLADRLNSAIEPPPTGLVSIVKGTVGQRDLAILRVGATQGSWFYLKGDPRFYVRTGNATRVLSAPTADVYRAANWRFSGPGQGGRG